jgi:prepilin-type N-terminal cleavage/methylation domain-containing protein
MAMMRRAATREHGFTLIEVLIVMSLFIVILGATLDVMVHFTQSNRLAERRNDQAEVARTALDRQARQLRNLAKPASGAAVAESINTAEGYDFIFRTSDPTRKWVRYCLDTSNAPATPARGRLWEMVSSSSSATVPGTAACPGVTAGWSSAQVVADHVVNRNNADNRIFTYSCLNGATPCPGGNRASITGVGTTLLIDDDVRRDPGPLKVSTGVFLRNQNQEPTADFSASRADKGKVFLNASLSSDPEGRTLRYFWYIGVTAPPVPCETPPTTQGVVLTHTFTGTPLPLTSPVTLVVCDPGNRSAQITKTVTVPQT